MTSNYVTEIEMHQHPEFLSHIYSYIKLIIKELNEAGLKIIKTAGSGVFVKKI